MSAIQKDIDSYLKTLCDAAEEKGATEAVVLSADDIVVDERVRLKCLVPVCSFYGRNLMCPPNVMPVTEFKSVLAGYHHAILIRIDAASPRLPDNFEGLNSLSEVWKKAEPIVNGNKQQARTTAEYFQTLRQEWERLVGIIHYIESLCIADGYPFVAGLSAGGCLLCDECVGYQSGLPCRHPFKARPSMEAMGIDVVATAKKAGLHVTFAAVGTRSWVGLILID
jgi:predicted metal-binding protein